MIGKTIFGVPPGELEASTVNVQTPLVRIPSESPLYVPGSQLTDSQIHGIGDDGSTFVPWRVDADGQAWYRRTSHPIQGVEPAAPIAAFDCDDVPPDSSVSDIVDRFRRETAIVQSRYLRGEIGDLFEASEYDPGSEGSDDE